MTSRIEDAGTQYIRAHTVSLGQSELPYHADFAQDKGASLGPEAGGVAREISSVVYPPSLQRGRGIGYE